MYNIFFKNFTKGLNYKGGRNNSGKITVRHRGCKMKHCFLNLDYKRSILNLKSIILMKRTSPRRNIFVNLVLYENGIFSYILSADNSFVGQILYSNDERYSNFVGNSLKLRNATFNSLLYNVEFFLGKGGQIARSAGCYVKILTKYSDIFGRLLVRFKSGEEYLLNDACFASVGLVSNKDYFLKNKEKAGYNRNMGFRPTVRGIAMNPVDHPHGGRSNGGLRRNYTGKLIKGIRTRSKIISKNRIKKRYNFVEVINKVRLYKEQKKSLSLLKKENEMERYKGRKKVKLAKKLRLKKIKEKK